MKNTLFGACDLSWSDPSLSVCIGGNISYVKIPINMDKIFAENILQGKVAFVTGGGTGITGGVARAFAEHGAKLAITSRKEENLAAMKAEVEGFGGECFMVAADVRDYAAVEDAIAKTVEHYGRSTSSSTARRAISCVPRISFRRMGLGRSLILILRARSTSAVPHSKN